MLALAIIIKISFFAGPVKKEINWSCPKIAGPGVVNKTPGDLYLPWLALSIKR